MKPIILFFLDLPGLTFAYWIFNEQNLTQKWC
jgi:hypothetical protein